MDKCCKCEKNEPFKEAGFQTICKECGEKIYLEQNPTLQAIKRLFADKRFDERDTKYDPENNIFPRHYGIPPLTPFEKREREYEREEIRQREYPSANDKLGGLQ